MIKLIALDLDGTTLQDGGILTDSTKETLEEVIRRGIHVVVASGRPMASMPESILELEGLEYSINSNGASVYSLNDLTCIRHQMVRPERVNEIIEILQQERFEMECIWEGKAYAGRNFIENPEFYGATPTGKKYIQKTRTPVDDIWEFAREHRDHLDAIDAIVARPEAKLLVENRLRELGDLYITSSVPSLIEITGPNAGKCAALEWLANMLGIRKEEIMACGNAENDREMVTFAAVGVAVANSSPELLAAADYVTDDNNHEGVANAIRRFVLQQRQEVKSCESMNSKKS